MLFLCALLFCCSCKNAHDKIVMEGDIKGGGSSELVLAMVTNDGLLMLDSVKMKDGHFRFEIKPETKDDFANVSTPMMYQLMLSPYNTLTTIAQGGDRLVFDAEAEGLVSSYRVSGGEEAVLVCQLDSALHAFAQSVEQLYAFYMKNLDDDSARAEVEKNYLHLRQEHKQYLQSFIQQHPDKMASYIAFYQSYNRGVFFNEVNDREMLETITQSLKNKYPNNPYIQNMQRRMQMLDLMEDDNRKQ